MITIAASKAKTYFNCGAALRTDIKLNPNFRSKSSDSAKAAEKGTLIHEVVENALNGNLSAMDLLEEKDRPTTSAYIDYIKSLEGYTLMIEEKFNYSLDSHIGNVTVRGVADLIAISPRRDHLVVADLKTGSAPVTVIDNPQLAAAAFSLLSSHGAGHVKTVEFVIVQNGFVNRHIYDKGAFDLMFDDYRVTLKDASFVRSSACEYCPKLLACPAMGLKTNQSLDHLLAEVKALITIGTIEAKEQAFAKSYAFRALLKEAKELLCDSLQGADKEDLPTIFRQKVPRPIETITNIEELEALVGDQIYNETKMTAAECIAKGLMSQDEVDGLCGNPVPIAKTLELKKCKLS